MQMSFRQYCLRYRHRILERKNLDLDFRVIEAWRTALPLTIGATFRRPCRSPRCGHKAELATSTERLYRAEARGAKRP
jgi:hypothetical protein